MSIARLANEWNARTVGRHAPGLDAAPGANSERFEILTKYIPTESITMFVAAMSGLEAARRLTGVVYANPWLIYTVFAILTPVLVWLVALVLFRETARTGGNVAAFSLPKFRMAAAFIAFLVWALAVPGLVGDPVVQIFASVGAVIISTVLSLLERLFGA